MRVRSSYKIIILLLILTGVGLVLRVQGVSFGLPYLYHQDERVTIGVVVKFGLGDLNPHYFWHPNLLHYLLFLLYGIYFFIGKLIGIFTTVTDFKDLFISNPTTFYLIGRVTGAIFGTATIPLLYLLGKRIYNKSVGLLAAFFLTFTFLHVRNSHYTRHDIPVTFFIVFSYIFIYRMFKTGKLKDYLLAGFVSGLAISTNWNAGVLVASIFTGHLLRILNPQKSLDIKTVFLNKKLFLCYFSLLVAVGLTSPYLFLDFNSAFPDFLHLFERATLVKTSGMPISKTGWWVYITYYLRIGMGIPLLILSICGVLLTVARRQKIDIILLNFPAFYYLLVGSVHGCTFAEYVIPMLPFLCLFAARFLCGVILKVNLRYSNKIRNILLLAVSTLVIFVPARYSIYHNYLLHQKDTRTLAKEWVEQHIPAGTTIAMERYIAINSWLPPLSESKEQNNEILKEIIKINPDKGKMRAALLTLPYPKITYNIIEIVDKFNILEKYENYYDFDKLISQGVRYVVLSSFWYDTYDKLNNMYEVERFYREIEARATLVKEFKPFRNGVEPFVQDHASHTPLVGVAKLIRPGPVIKIYKITAAGNYNLQ